METYGNDVVELLESELAGRYFYDSGMVRYSLTRDTQVSAAISIAGDRARYASLLKGTATI